MSEKRAVCPRDNCHRREPCPPETRFMCDYEDTTPSPQHSSELMPCPFCGRSGPTIVGYWPDMAGRNPRVRCTCGVAVGGGIDEAADREQWNARAALTSEPRPDVHEIKSVLRQIVDYCDADDDSFVRLKAADLLANLGDR